MGALAIAGAANTTINKILNFIQMFYSPKAVTTRLRKKTIRAADVFSQAFDNWAQAKNKNIEVKYFAILLKRRREYKEIRRRIR